MIIAAVYLERAYDGARHFISDSNYLDNIGNSV